MLMPQTEVLGELNYTTRASYSSFGQRCPIGLTATEMNTEPTEPIVYTGCSTATQVTAGH